MFYQKTIAREQDSLDIFSATFCRVLFYIVVFTCVVNEFNIFIIDKPTVRSLTLISFFILITPTILLKYMKNRVLWRYFTVTCVVFQVGLLFTILSFHAVFLFAFPASLMATYGDEKLKNFTNNLTAISMLISHILSVHFSIIFDDPFISSYQSMILFGFVPRFICFFGYVRLINFLSKRNAESLTNIAQLATELHESQESLIRQFSTLSESKSGQTGKHIKRVAKLMDIFSDELGIIEEKEDLAIASMMHDIGKLLIDEKIIEKPAKLTNEEFNLIKNHTLYGYKLLEHSPGRIMEIARDIAMDHHEKWDGSGYSGKKGEEINYYARIMAIIDVFDALTSVRSYKPAWSYEASYEEIVLHSGTHFDPELVEVFKKCYPKLRQVIEDLPDDETDTDFLNIETINQEANAKKLKV